MPKTDAMNHTLSNGNWAVDSTPFTHEALGSEDATGEPVADMDHPHDLMPTGQTSGIPDHPDSSGWDAFGATEDALVSDMSDPARIFERLEAASSRDFEALGGKRLTGVSRRQFIADDWDEFVR